MDKFAGTKPVCSRLKPKPAAHWLQRLPLKSSVAFLVGVLMGDS